MAITIKTYQPSDAKLKCLVYGPSGIGKTTFGATAPKPIFVSAEAGLLSVADKSIPYAEIKSMQDLRDVYEHLRKNAEGFQTVVIDSLTEIQSFIIGNITGGKRMPQKGEWSDFGFEMTKILRAYRDLPMHVIFLALETERDEEDDGKSRFMPDLYGKARTAGAAFMDFVGRMSHYGVQEGDAKVPKRGICFTANERFIAKDRSGKLPGFVLPDFTAMLQAVGTIPTGDGEVIAEIGLERIKQLSGLATGLGTSLEAVYEEFGIKGKPTDAQLDTMIGQLALRKSKERKHAEELGALIDPNL